MWKEKLCGILVNVKELVTQQNGKQNRTNKVTGLDKDWRLQCRLFQIAVGIYDVNTLNGDSKDRESPTVNSEQ